MSTSPTQTRWPREATLTEAVWGGATVALGILTALAISGQWQPVAAVVSDALTQVGRALGAAPAADARVYWYMSRSSGVVAYLLLWGSMAWGLMVTSKVLDGVARPSLTYELHQFLSVLALAVGAFHAVILLGDTYMQFTLLDLLIPFRSSYQPLWVGAGILACYLSALLVGSFYIKKRLGQRAWRVLHFASFGAWVMITLHGVLAGTDSATPVMVGLYLCAIASISFLLTYRILMIKPRRVARG